jgi:outer membrane protein
MRLKNNAMSRQSQLALFIIVIISLGKPVFAQPNKQSDKKEYTLNECYISALKHAEKIGIAKEAVAIAEFTRKQALSVLIPTFTALGTYQHYNEKKEAHGNLIQPKWDGSLGVSIAQSVTLNGRELTALHIAEQGIEQSTFDLEVAKESYLYNVASAFFDVAKLYQGVLIAKANVVRLMTYKNALVTRLKLGDTSKTELFRTEAELANADAQLLATKNQHELAKAFLARLTGLNAPFGIKEPQISVMRLKTTELTGLKEVALNNRAELKSYMAAESISAKQVNYAQGAYWPRLGLEGSWIFFEQEPDPMLKESAWLGANLTFDIFDGGLRKSQLSQARALQKQARLTLDDAKNDINIEVERAYLNWQTQQSVIKSFESQLRYAKENYNASVQLSEHGMANSVDIMDANTLLVTADWQLAEARYNLQLAILGIERSTGVFLTAVERRLTK